jgi:predicted DNA-binding protein (MmcQ/YjbR family)
MDIEELRSYCLNRPGVSESFPFDEETLVFKVLSKMFCLTNLNQSLSVNLKCEPEKAIELREEYEEIIPGFHMNKKHWNTINLEGSLSNKMLKELIDDSYLLVAKNLSSKEKRSLNLDN